MGCEQYKATDYSAKARACREKENEDLLPKEEVVEEQITEEVIS